MHPAQVHTAETGDKIHGRRLEGGDIRETGDLYPWHGGWRSATTCAGSPVGDGVSHKYVRPTTPSTFLSAGGLTYVVGGGGTFTAHAPDMVPHPDGGEPLRGRKLLRGDVLQKGDRCSTEAGWCPVDWSIALGCAPGESVCTFVRPAPEPPLPDGYVLTYSGDRRGAWGFNVGDLGRGGYPTEQDAIASAVEHAAAPLVEPVLTYCWAVDSACRTHLVECRDGEPYRSRRVGDDHWGVYRARRDSFELWGDSFEL